MFPTLPGLVPGQFDLTSEQTPDYNCIAWAVGDSRRWWWPLPIYYWPKRAPQEESLEAFVVAFATRGYAPCADGDLVPGIEKVALFAIAARITHAARQLEDGMWTSKLGQSYDIRHTLTSLEGGEYGQVVAFLGRPRQT